MPNSNGFGKKTRGYACLPITDENWPSEIAELRDGFAGALNVYRTMAHHPDLLRAWVALRQHVVRDSALGPEKSELVILRAAYRMGSDYEWAHHVSRSRAIGISDDRIAAMRNNPVGEDGLIARAVDALFDSAMLTRPLEQELAAAIGRRGIFDLMATIGFYSTLGFILKTFETPLDEPIVEELKLNPI